MTRTAALLTLVGLAITAPASAQGNGTGGEAPPPPTPSSTLLLRVQSSRATLETARDVSYELAERPLSVRIQLFDIIARRLALELRHFARDRQKLIGRAARVVPQLQRKQLDKGGATEVEKLRREALALTRGPDLSKQIIKSEIDPRLQRLRQLVLVRSDDVIAHDETLRQQIDALYTRRDILQGWVDLYLDSRNGLGDEPAGRRHLEKREPLPDPPPYEVIEADIELQCMAALPLSGRDRKTLTANEALRDSIAPEEYLGTLALNRIRIALGLAAVGIDEKLGNAARDHSTDMKNLGFFSHTSPVEGKRTPGQRAARAGTSGGTENIARGQNTGAGAIRSWWYSPGHHKNMLGGHSRTGLGQCEQLWTQMFGS